ncbi:hypothetical protein [Candidatus Nitrosotalea okcheonensis]|uniref:Uncharacterized protein n=1 Tax=Candidatus Nitrosotalea okcheonensis TaxID=1903276 RepID=A0A2H1FD64_9ARCH|nr:hypothetical protein [Candidatus Nitrosotalea okcheonensis]MDE1728763.1 hypothetical protein [Nitrososphaerota archaeon]MDE1840972.1 hypothetical protein [Nitrososphaerota archaeon]MDE1877355.1 hypothetical protein [Nitrososphaerota archaeon]SMH70708.1 conserved protein of unknown function [Candidatus Nitrosotalea okcheonensis]
MTLSSREETIVITSHLISLYSEMIEEGKISQNQSVIDFLMKNIPPEFKSELSIDLIDDVFTFIASRPMELS